MVAFAAWQRLDMLSPSNGMLGNPVTLQGKLAEGGANLVRCTLNAAEDPLRETLSLQPVCADTHVVGLDVAITPGKVVMCNRLAELIQYQATKSRKLCEPVLLVAAWIMKYRGLDLSPLNLLVKSLVDEGFNLFATSWKNPSVEDRETTLAGVLQAWQLKGNFQMLRSQDPIWSCRVINHLLCERLPGSDLMAWNADGTLLP